MSITGLCIVDAGGRRGVACVICGEAPGWELIVSEHLSSRGCTGESRSEKKNKRIQFL